AHAPFLGQRCAVPPEDDMQHIPNSYPPRVRIISDNPLYKPYEGSGEEVNIIGRIRWFAREM
ncbi:MAG: hypothetical protein WCD75_20830, partial [Rhodoplanes sp.]